MFLSSLYFALLAKLKNLADHRDVLSPDLFSHGSRSSTSRSDLLKLPNKFILRLRGCGTLKYGDVHEKFNFLEIQDLRPLRTCQKHFETILPNFLPDECEI